MAGAPKYGRCSEHTRKGGGAPAPLCRAMLYFGSRHTVPSAMRGCICTWHTEADAPHVSLACDCELYGGWGPRIDVVCVSVRAALWGVMWTMVRGGRGLPLRLRGLFVDVVTRVCSAARARHPHSGSTARRVSRREGATASVSSAVCRARTLTSLNVLRWSLPNPVRSAFAHGTPRNDKSRTGRARGRVARDDELRQTQTALGGSFWVVVRIYAI